MLGRLLFVLVALVPICMVAQTPVDSALTVGARVRISTRTVSGIHRVEWAGADSAAYARQRDGQVLWLAHGELTYLSVERGERSDMDGALRSGTIGVGIGFAIGALIGLLDGDDPANAFLRFTAAEKAVAFGGVLGAAGGLIGIVSGIANPGRHWVQVSLPLGR